MGDAPKNFKNSIPSEPFQKVLNEKDDGGEDYQEQTDGGTDSDDDEVDVYEEDLEVEDKFHCRLWYQHSRIDVRVSDIKLRHWCRRFRPVRAV